MKIILSHYFSPWRQRGEPEASICCVIKGLHMKTSDSCEIQVIPTYFFFLVDGLPIFFKNRFITKLATRSSVTFAVVRFMSKMRSTPMIRAMPDGGTQHHGYHYLKPQFFKHVLHMLSFQFSFLYFADDR